MKRKNDAIMGKSLIGEQEKACVPYYVDNIFYASFGMSCDEVFESLKKSDFFEMN